MKQVRKILQAWNSEKSSYAKLQYTYGALAIGAVFASGLVSLINYGLGQSILFVATILTLVFIANGVIWALLSTFVLSQLDRTTPPASRRKK